MSWANRREVLKLALILFWLLFTVTFAIWWLTLSVEHISLLARLQPEAAEHWDRQRRMMFAEGSAWVVLLVLGGGALIAFVQKERQRVAQIREFFASFSHEVKTSLASLRLQAEALKDDLAEQPMPVLDRLVADTVRLQLQLENSLFLSSQDSLQLYPQSLRLSALVDLLREQWPNLNLELRGDCWLYADERAVRTILSNLLQNAIVHGKASSIVLEPKVADQKRICIRFHDNGEGFAGDAAHLGRLFYRPTRSSGSGLGLYICRLLLAKMNGELTLHPDHRGFRVDLILEGHLK